MLLLTLALRATAPIDRPMPPPDVPARSPVEAAGAAWTDCLMTALDDADPALKPARVARLALKRCDLLKDKLAAAQRASYRTRKLTRPKRYAAEAAFLEQLSDMRRNLVQLARDRQQTPDEAGSGKGG